MGESPKLYWPMCEAHRPLIVLAQTSKKPRKRGFLLTRSGGPLTSIARPARRVGGSWLPATELLGRMLARVYCNCNTMHASSSGTVFS